MTIDLTTLPSPDVVEVLDFDAILQRRVDTFQAQWAAVRATYPDAGLPDYDVSLLETDPAKIIFRVEAYAEYVLRARGNDIAKANLLAFTFGADLDHLAADHNVERLAGESDDRLKRRVILADQAKSCAGPEEWYIYHAMSVSIDVADVAVHRPGTGPQIAIAILSVSNGGVASDALLAQVLAKLTQKGIKGYNDVISVERAVKEVVNVVADIWLLPDTPTAVFDGLEAVLRAAWVKEAGIGFDLLRDWIRARLMPAGIYKVTVTAPATDKVAADAAAYALGTVTLNFKGRGR